MNERLRKVKILLLCNPCHGFGDIIFAMKLMKYIVSWYDCKVKIATTTPDSFLKLGASRSDIILLNSGEKPQCRRFTRLTPSKPIGVYDLYIVAPLPADNKISQRDITTLIPSASKENTIFFSEYNDSLDKGFHFNTGIGKGRDGIFLTEIPHSSNIFKGLGKYAVAYLAETISKSDVCFLNFLNMVSSKYKMANFTVVAPGWIKDISDLRIKRNVSKHYKNIMIHTSDETRTITNDKGTGTLHIRCDIFPIPNKDMLTLMKYSVHDILLTGDQSITDALSCCHDKNIFYQIAPWKKDFAKELSIELPNKYLSSSKTSCGTNNAIKYKSNYKKFIKEWDFSIRGKPKMDEIIQSIL